MMLPVRTSHRKQSAPHVQAGVGKHKNNNNRGVSESLPARSTYCGLPFCVETNTMAMANFMVAAGTCLLLFSLVSAFPSLLGTTELGTIVTVASAADTDTPSPYHTTYCKDDQACHNHGSCWQVHAAATQNLHVHACNVCTC